MLIDWVTVAAQAVNFLLLVWLLHRFLFKPVLKVVNEREQKIRKQIEDAQLQQTQARKEREALSQEKEELLQRKEALLSQAQEDAKKERESLIKQVRFEADTLRRSFQEKIHNEQKTVFFDLRKQFEGTVFHIARKVLEDITQERFQESVVRAFIHKLDEMASDQKNIILEDIRMFPGVLYVRSAFTLSPENKDHIEKALRAHFGEGISLSFEVNPDLICGVEFATSGHKVSWNIAEYIFKIQDNVCRL
jgi:F-type H+-transporting ATPase subunit b